MTEGLARLAARRQVLVARCAAERVALAQHIEPWRRPLEVASRSLAVIRSVQAHPAWIVGAAVLPGALLPGRMGTWLRRGFLAYQAFRRLRGATAVPTRAISTPAVPPVR